LPERIPIVGLPAADVHAALVKGMLAAEPPKRTLSELMPRVHTVTGLAEEIGKERATLREKLDASDMLITSLVTILNQLGFDLESEPPPPKAARSS
jgi:hypothetical protein